ncbi:phosphofurin acidic cluster sorting protein 1-like isoform X6 [Mytilus californianus]|uniref:phosphofurin acidic cluster sorting protein 1-like isoform X6 n=1 Tax=Mytilus californianus TaxID=6549 RepID=UPI002246B1BD|nr:phosphofurin acidic cluster sorting protein 1-like isoform X6 [Mytilus californianus]
MADKTSKAMGSGSKPVPMKLFATWEVEKTPPNCIPRLCSLTLDRLQVLKALENDLATVIIAVKMQGSKRILRSNEISVPANGLLDTELDLSFSLQYPHYLKRDGNNLQVMLQRRKKYKNKTILGYRILAIGQVNMDQVLQKNVDKELHLFSEAKEHTKHVAQVRMVSLSSQPVDHVENGQGKTLSSYVEVDRSPDVDNDSDDDEIEDDVEYWSNAELSDSEPVMLARPRKSSRGKIHASRGRVGAAQQQRNIKQRFIALLKRFRITEEGLESEGDHGLEIANPDASVDIDDLFDELEDLSDSGPELDTVSVMSTPKPRLRPFFAGKGGNADVTESMKSGESGRMSDDGSKKNDCDSHYMYIATLPRKALLEQLSAVLAGSDDQLPDNIILVNTAEWQGQFFLQKLQEKQFKVICTCGNADVKAAVSNLVHKIQKFCNTNPKKPSPVKIAIAGADGYINSVLRPYVEQFSAKPPDWQGYVRFLVIPFGNSCIGKNLGTLDATYSSLFLDQSWKDTFDKTESIKLDSQEIINRVSKYLSSASTLLQIPIAEAMVMCKGKSGEDESCQNFIPFFSEVKIGNPESTNASGAVQSNEACCVATVPGVLELARVLVDFDDVSTVVNSPALLSSSPPSNNTLEKQKETNTPPSSPNVGIMATSNQSSSTPIPVPGELLELQIEYWTTPVKIETSASKKDSNKITLKTTFKYIHVQRLAQPGIPMSDLQSSTFTMLSVMKEKKQKIMRLKKAKETESKSHTVDGISRLICTSKSQNHSLKVTVDGVEWTGVKFFQLSAQWQTHIKHFPVVLFGFSDS